MELLIFEDEPLAAERLEDLVKKNHPDWEIAGVAQSNQQAIALLQEGVNYDLILCDIQLTDGHSFEIFKQVEVTKPVIFTTAYDQFALESFQHNSIDYILKPINEKRLEEAFQKYQLLTQSQGKQKRVQLTEDVINQMLSLQRQNQYKKRFISKLGNKIVFKSVDEVAYFYAEGKIVYLKEKGTGNRFIINHSLEELEQQLLDPSLFYRINRSIIVNLDSLLEMKTYHNGRLKLLVNAENDIDIIVARERVSHFKNWINQ